MVPFLLFFFSLLAPLTGGASPQPVKVSAYINDIHFVDLKTHTYSVDFYLTFRWSDKKLNPIESFEFMNSFEQWGFSIKPEKPSPQILPNGDLYNTLRIEGKFSKKFDLSNYPFDQQDLLISGEDIQSDRSEIRYMVDDLNPVSVNPKMTLPGFALGSVRIETEEFSHPTAFGNAFQGSPQTTYSRFNLIIPIERPILAYMFKLLLPILCVFFCSGLMFMIVPHYFDARIGIGITSLLTVVALQITLNEELPEIGYLVLIDKIYLITYLFIIISLTNVVRVARQLERGLKDPALIINSDRRALFIFVLVYVLLCGIVTLRFR